MRFGRVIDWIGFGAWVVMAIVTFGASFDWWSAKPVPLWLQAAAFFYCGLWGLQYGESRK